MARSMKPQPVVVQTVCSLCDLPWEDHGDEPSALDCIRLLKERPATTVCPGPHYPWTWTWTHDQTFPAYTINDASSATTVSNGATTNVVYLTPHTDEPPDDAVTAAV